MKTNAFTGGIYFDPTTEALKKLFRVTEEKIMTFEPDQVTIPFDQHIGAPNEPIVKIGQQVKQGQLIAKSPAAVSGYVHASISGQIVAIEEVPELSGGTQTAITIKRSADNDWEPLPPEASADDRIRHAGIVGMGGATFPTHIKLDPDPAINVETIILNGAECEPFLVSDDYLMRYQAAKILQGAVIARELLGAKQILVGIEADKPLAVTAMQTAAAEISDCFVTALPVKYPQGGEKELLETLIGKESPLNGRSVETGAYTMNVATSFAIREALAENKALTHRLITVTGDIKQPRVVKFPLGTRVCDLIEFCGGSVGDPMKIIHGGPMMGRTIPDITLPLTKGSNGLILLNAEHAEEWSESPCIRCNRCSLVCPIRLEPHLIDQAYRAGDLYRCNQLMAEECINCGCCSYVCPARRSLAEKITAAGKAIKEIKEVEK